MRAVSTHEEQLHRLYAHIARDLSYRFDGVFAFESVERVVAESRDELDRQARIKDFLPVLTERLAHDRLRDAARVEVRYDGRTLALLFVCSRHAGRAHLGSALAHHEAGDRVFTRIAGTVTSSAVQEEVTATLAELDVRLIDLVPTRLTDKVVSAADVVITLGGGDACPVVPGTRYCDWDVLDPVGQDLATVRTIRDDVHARVRTLVSELGL